MSKIIIFLWKINNNVIIKFMNKIYNKIYWSTLGQGKIHIVFIHGWGLHSIVWKKIITLLQPYFTLHIMDLPGFGKSCKCPIMHIKQLSIYFLKKITDKVIWVGWSMGGLIAHYLGFYYPQYTIAVIYITSSPCFIKKKNWPGITSKILFSIKKNILLDYQEFLKKFILFHIIRPINKSVIKLKQNYFFTKKYPNPKEQAIEIGYQWLTKIDQRKKILNHNIPILRIYGSLDKLVPVQTCSIIDTLWGNNNSFVIANAQHAPFLSHPNTVCNILKKFIKQNNIFSF